MKLQEIFCKGGLSLKAHSKNDLLNLNVNVTRFIQVNRFTFIQLV